MVGDRARSLTPAIPLSGSWSFVALLLIVVVDCVCISFHFVPGATHRPPSADDRRDAYG